MGTTESMGDDRIVPDRRFAKQLADIRAMAADGPTTLDAYRGTRIPVVEDDARGSSLGASLRRRRYRAEARTVLKAISAYEVRWAAVGATATILEGSRKGESTLILLCRSGMIGQIHRYAHNAFPTFSCMWIANRGDGRFWACSDELRLEDLKAQVGRGSHFARSLGLDQPQSAPAASPAGNAAGDDQPNGTERMQRRAADVLRRDPDATDATGARIDALIGVHLPRLLRTHRETTAGLAGDALERADRMFEEAIDMIEDSVSEAEASQRSRGLDALETELRFHRSRRAA